MTTEEKQLLNEYKEFERGLTHTGIEPQRGATEGPLKDLIPVFIDFETWMSDEVRLGNMTLRQYLSASHLTAMSIAVGYDEPEVYLVPNGVFLPDDEDILLVIEKLAEDEKYVFVAHNAAFDIRVMTMVIGTSWPKNVWCTMEGAMGAWPELPGGYGLENIGKRLNFKSHLRKLTIDLSKCSDEELLEYNKRDVRVLQELYARETALLPGVEQEVALRTHRQRQFYFSINPEKLQTLMTELEKQALYAEQEAEQYLTDPADLGEIFNRDGGTLRSVRSARLLKIINKKMGGDFASTSLKKINPIKLAQHQRISALLQQTSTANKMLSHFRRSKVFIDCNEIDVELGYMRAHTGRFSSPQCMGSRGLNLHGIPKHNKAIAKPIRSIFRLPEDKCFVRGDFSNIEYRVNAKLCNCKTVYKMFEVNQGGNIFSDPYCLAWKAMTGQVIDKKNPTRQLAKSAVLGLGFCMGPTTYARQNLLPALADKKSGTNEEVLHEIARKLDWKDPNGDGVKKVIEMLGCSHIVALCSYHIHKAFNVAHPEFAMTADWLVSAVTSIASVLTREQGDELIDKLYQQSRAPDRNMIGLEIDKDKTFDVLSVRVRCGPDWCPTVIWRAPRTRPTNFIGGASERKLTILKANKQFKPVSRQILIENTVQAAARNGLCRAVAELEKLGFPNVLHIHDEILIICEKSQKEVLAAREALIKVSGPKSTNPLGWACLINPSGINVSQSMYEDEEDSMVPKLDEKTGKMVGGDRWGRIERNEVGCLDNLV